LALGRIIEEIANSCRRHGVLLDFACEGNAFPEILLLELRFDKIETEL
jgi:hypothetical protein